jgi:hypothetical protein
LHLLDPDLSRQDQILKEQGEIIATHHPGCQRTRALANPLLAPYDVTRGVPEPWRISTDPQAILARESSAGYLQIPNRIPRPMPEGDARYEIQGFSREDLARSNQI